MKGSKIFVWLLTIIALITLSVLFYTHYKPTQKSEQPSFTDDVINVTDDTFSDGLPLEADSKNIYEQKEFEEGPSEKLIYYIDINNDDVPDRITKTFFETFNAHSYYEYTIELKIGDKYKNITPENLHTVSGADCDLKLIQFNFKPKFTMTVISRNLGDTWSEPTMATKQIFKLSDNKLVISEEKTLRKVCDVMELF